MSNIQAGAGPAWYLLDTTRAIKPFVDQDRIAATFAQLTRDDDENVFINDSFVYGVRARRNAGFGLWQLAYASKADLTPASYEAARAAMMQLRGDEGRLLDVKPNMLLAPSSLEGAAMRLLNNGTCIETVVQNEWAGTAKPIITAWLS